MAHLSEYSNVNRSDANSHVLYEARFNCDFVGTEIRRLKCCEAGPRVYLWGYGMPHPHPVPSYFHHSPVHAGHTGNWQFIYDTARYKRWACAEAKRFLVRYLEKKKKNRSRRLTSVSPWHAKHAYVYYIGSYEWQKQCMWRFVTRLKAADVMAVRVRVYRDVFISRSIESHSIW